MTAGDRRAAFSRATQPPTWRLRKVGGWWFLADLERPGEFLPSVMFSRRKDAVEYATRNACALMARYREEGYV